MFKKYNSISFFYFINFNLKKLIKKDSRLFLSNLIFFNFLIFLFKLKKTILKKKFQNIKQNSKINIRFDSLKKNQKYFVQKYNFNVKKFKLNFLNLRKKKKIKTKLFFL